MSPVPTASDFARFWAKVDKTSPDGCWLWTAGLNRGYGSFYPGPNSGRSAHAIGAHRWLYEALIGPVPADLDLDHTCHSPSICAGGETCPHRACVNPAHLEPVTRRENLARGVRSVYWAAKTHCPQGHPYDEENTYRHPRDGRRFCRACQRARWRERSGASR